MADQRENTRVWEDDSDTEVDMTKIDLDKRNRELQEHFAAEMKDIAKLRSHKKVAVLLISWEKEGEEYLDTVQEVRDLRQVFEEKYHYTVHEAQLHARKGKSANDQMNYFLAKFKLDEDGRDTLLIVYYAGHGVKDMKDGHLRLLGGNPKVGNKSLTQIVWNEAEILLQKLQADLLVIFDCCYAGVLGRPHRSPFSNKIFEFLGATQCDKTALGPGRDSFTSGLVWALKQLSGETEGFTVTQLKWKIQEAPYFRDNDQEPVATDRGQPSLNKLKIVPLVHDYTESNDSESSHGLPTEDLVAYHLHLQLLWSRCPRRGHISALSDALRDLVKRSELPIKQVLWQGLSDKDTKLELRDIAAVARKFVHRVRQKSLARKLNLARHPAFLSPNPASLEEMSEQMYQSPGGYDDNTPPPNGAPVDYDETSSAPLTEHPPGKVAHIGNVDVFTNSIHSTTYRAVSPSGLLATSLGFGFFFILGFGAARSKY